MTIYERIETAKKKHGLNNRLLGEVVGDSEMAFGQIMRRQTLTKLKEKAINEYLDSLEGIETKNPIQESKGIEHYISENEILKKQNELNDQTIKELLKSLSEVLRTLNK